MNFLGSSLSHDSPHQQCRDLLFVIIGKLKPEYRGLRARRHANGYYANRFLTWCKVLSLEVIFQHRNWNLLLRCDSGRLLITKL